MSAENQLTINEWITQTFGETGSNFSVAARANEEMAELLMGLAVDDNHPKAVEECADIVIILFRLAERQGQDLMAAIDRKMRINRKRQWNVAHGHGYHVTEGHEVLAALKLLYAHLFGPKPPMERHEIDDFCRAVIAKAETP